MVISSFMTLCQAHIEGGCSQLLISPEVYESIRQHIRNQNSVKMLKKRKEWGDWNSNWLASEISRVYPTIPCAIMALAIFKKPAMFAPTTRFPDFPYFSAAARAFA